MCMNRAGKALLYSLIFQIQLGSLDVCMCVFSWVYTHTYTHTQSQSHYTSSKHVLTLKAGPEKGLHEGGLTGV